MQFTTILTIILALPVIGFSQTSKYTSFGFPMIQAGTFGQDAQTCLKKDTVATSIVQNAVIPVVENTGLMGTRATLWDNGDTDGSGGISNADAGAFGYRRTCLDDFEIPPGETWIISDFHSYQMWNFLPPGSGWDYTLSFWTDNAGIPGTPIVTATTVSYNEVATGRVWYGRDEYETQYVFDPLVLTEGIYWIEGNVVGPEDNFWMIHPNPPWRSSAWVDFEDFGGLQSGLNLFGVCFDFAFWLTGFKGSLDIVPDTIDGNTGGLTEIRLPVGSYYAFRPYGIFASLTGTGPSTLPDGTLLPITFDALTFFLIDVGLWFGYLDSIGYAAQPINVPPLPGYSDFDIYFAAAIPPPPLPWWASNSAVLHIVY